MNFVKGKKRHTLLHFISTGGTIEKNYSESEGVLFNCRNKLFSRDLLEQLWLPNLKVKIHAPLAKDSLHMDETDRLKIASFLQKLLPQGSPMVVLHGTDTMDATAFYCHKLLKPRAPIVFTGSMRPLGLIKSDGRQNVIEAMLAARTLPPGIYLAFHGQLFKAPHFIKNRKKLTFEYQKRTALELGISKLSSIKLVGKSFQRQA